MKLSFPIMTGWQTTGCLVLGCVILLPSLWYFYTRIVIPKISLRGARVVITGGSEGIGLQIARYCVLKGAHVVILARNEEKLGNAAESLSAFKASPDQVIGVISADISDHNALAKEVADTFGADFLNWQYIDCLVCNAGVESVGSMEDTPVAVYQRIMNVNYFGAVHCMKILLPYLKRHHTKCARIVAVNSLLGLLSMPYYSAYCASKYALRGFLDAVTPELAAYNILTSIVYPPDVKTEQYKREKSATNVPKEILQLSSDSGVFEAEVVGRDIANVLENGTFSRSWGIDGWMLVNLTAGFSIANSYSDSLAQMLGNGVFRVIAMWYAQTFYQTARTHTNVRL